MTLFQIGLDVILSIRIGLLLFLGLYMCRAKLIKRISLYWKYKPWQHFQILKELTRVYNCQPLICTKLWGTLIYREMFYKINTTLVLGTLMVHIPCRFHQLLWSFETCFSSNGTFRTFIQMIR